MGCPSSSCHAQCTLETRRECTYLRSPSSPQGWNPRTCAQGGWDRLPESPRSSAGSRCGHRLGAQPVTRESQGPPHPHPRGCLAEGPHLPQPITSEAGPSPFDHTFPSCKTHPDRRANSRGPGNLTLPPPTGLQGRRPPHLGPGAPAGRAGSCWSAAARHCCRLRTCSSGRCHL